MKPTWERAGIQLYLGDCREILPTLEKGRAAVTITDPPYANGTPYDGYDDTRDALRRLIEGFLPEARRISAVVLITCGVGNMWLYPEPTWTLSWVRPAGTGYGPWGFTCWTPILAYGPDPMLKAGLGCRPDVINRHFTRETSLDHPCPKPVGLMEWLVERSSFEGDTVLDCFMGTGATAEACWNTGRHFIGCERSPKYFDLAIRRLDAALDQGRLFFPSHSPAPEPSNA